MIKVGTAHKIVAPGAAKFAPFIDQFMAALQTVAPMLTLTRRRHRAFIFGWLIRFHRAQKPAIRPACK